MSSFRLFSLLASSLFLAGAPAPSSQDYTTIPPAPGDVYAMLGTRQPLAKAIEAAEKETGGRAREAAFGANDDVTVHTYSSTSHFVVEVDGESGAIRTKTERLRFPGAPVEGVWTELPSGLRYYDLVVGKGEKPAGPTTTVKAHYTGWLTDGTKFHSSVDSGQPAILALNQFIKGWTEGVGSMQVGGKRKLIIPFELAYGPGGSRGIPPHATLIFDVELLEIIK